MPGTCCSFGITLHFVWLLTCTCKYRFEHQERLTWKYFLAIVSSTCHFSELAGVLHCLYLPAASPAFVRFSQCLTINLLAVSLMFHKNVSCDLLISGRWLELPIRYCLNNNDNNLLYFVQGRFIPKCRFAFGSIFVGITSSVAKLQLVLDGKTIIV